MKIRKAVIPAAGLGTRFLPATKAVPKELLPIVDVPTIQYIVKEIVDSGITDVIFVTGRGKNAILDHFDSYPELEEKLTREGKTELAATLREASSMVKVVSVRQPVPKGLGDAVFCCEDLVGDEPFAVLLGDDLVDAAIPCTRQMIDVFEKYDRSVVALMPVADDEISRFGVGGGKMIAERVMDLDKMVEKPALKDAPSNLAIIGRYILKPSIFRYIRETKPGKGGEIQLTDAMAEMMRREGFLGYQFTGERYDAGDKFGFLQAGIAYGLKRPDIAPKLKNYMREILKAG